MAEVGMDRNRNQGTALELRVSGMTCHGCEQAISLLLKQHPAVDRVDADARCGIVRVWLRERVEIAELKERVRAAGFEVE